MSPEIQVFTTYFGKPGKENTQRTLELAKKRAEELGIKTILVASTRGETGVKACEAFRGYDVVVVTHDHGDHKGTKFTPQEYCRRYLAYRKAMRAVDPNVKLGAILSEQREALSKRHGTAEFRFRVVVEDGRAKLKASRVK